MGASLPYINLFARIIYKGGRILILQLQGQICYKVTVVLIKDPKID